MVSFSDSLGRFCGRIRGFVRTPVLFRKKEPQFVHELGLFLKKLNT